MSPAARAFVSGCAVTDTMGHKNARTVYLRCMRSQEFKDEIIELKKTIGKSTCAERNFAE